MDQQLVDEEEAIWYSCPNCNALPGDPCKPPPELDESSVHQDRINMARFLKENP
jgi:hypothetical protein